MFFLLSLSYRITFPLAYATFLVIFFAHKKFFANDPEWCYQLRHFEVCYLYRKYIEYFERINAKNLFTKRMWLTLLLDVSNKRTDSGTQKNCVNK